ncbi:cell division control protein 24 [Blastomyces parvus]|uniref:Cell division control protein 24 n=1 Tax=Blastomyces parvus TaxID=2060905 RepID=A0A2B7WZJ2_9EURO|nr:cell division control protein 24 [Blastomyces parvus]
MDPTTSNGGPVMAEDNIINRRGGESLFQSCASLKKRLTEVPGFDAHLAEMEEMDRAEDAIDPVASVWRCLRQGYPLMTIFNASNPAEPLAIDPDKVPEARRPKAAAFKFLQACLQDLEFPQQECFLITDLYGENTTGFVKVIKMVSRVLDILEMRGQLYQSSVASTGPRQGEKVKLTRKEHILKELLETERDYVHHLQNLQALKKELEETGALNGDSSHQIFLNLNNLLDFTQRFLIRMEQHNALPEEMQNWGELFIQHQEGFRQYEPFIANQLRCDAVCQKEWDKIKVAPRSVDLQQMVAQPSTLNGFFVKPFQRLTKYPLMLMELKKQTDLEDLIADISTAIDIVQTVLDQANRAVEKEHLANAVDDLAIRVDDWKALKVEVFGELLRFGTFTVLKGDGGRDTEREVRTSLTAYNARLRPAPQCRLSFHKGPMRIRLRLLYTPPLAPDQAFHKKLSGIYLPFGTPSQDLSSHWPESAALTWRSKFHSASLKWLNLPTSSKRSPPHLPPISNKQGPLTLQANISTEEISSYVNLNKQKTKLMSKDKPNAAPKGKPRLQLKGRIYMANVTEILSLQKPGSYKIQIFWKGDPGVVDNFAIRYQNEDTMRKWYKDIDTQRAIQTEERATRHTGTSETEFTYLKMGPKIQNPYREEYEAEEELVRETNTFSEFSVSRNASSTSLRARSATGGSGNSGPISNRPPRFPMPEPPLSVSTQFANGAISPGDRNGNSYFSPVTDATSTRSSSQSTMFSYSRQGTPSTPWTEDSNRYTAPAMPRAASRDGATPNPYFSNGNQRGAQRPSLPPLSSSHHGQSSGMSQARMRSASSPDIHHNSNMPDSRRHVNGHSMQTVDNVPVPPIPAHMASMRAPVNRSQNNSPINNALPVRTATQSPGIQQRHGLPSNPFPESRSQPAPTSNPMQSGLSSPVNQETEQELYMPSQLKAKVNFDDNYVTLVIASNILFRSLTDRVDAKLARFTDRSIGNKSVRLRYRDEDGDFVTIDSDEAVQLAFMEWRDQHQNMLANGQVGEIQLFCQPVEN